jgi:hypothetical protein
MRQQKAIRKLWATAYSREYAETNNLRILSTAEYSQEFNLSKSAICKNLKSRHLKGFKQGNRWFILIT